MAQRAHHVTPEMQNLAKAYTERGIAGVAEEIAALDLLFAPQLNDSRLATPAMKEHAVLLLAQVAPDMMHAMLDNTLAEKVVAGTIKLNDWNRIPRTNPGDREPAIYVNYFAKPAGTGLSRPEFFIYIQFMEAALSGKMIQYQNVNRNVVQEVDDYFKKRTGEQTPFSQQSTFKNGIKELATFSTSARRLHLQAKTAGCTEIRFHGEVGWSIETDQRIKTHHKLQGSAFFFRLAICVVNILFPQYKFKLFSYCMFRVVMWNHVEIGESIGSHLASSYPGNGGLNFKTAGISVSSAITSGANIWQQVSIQYKDCLDYAQAVLEQYDKDSQAELNDAKDQLAIIRRTLHLEDLGAELEKAQAEATKSSDDLAIAQKQSARQTKSLRKVVDSKEAEAKKLHDALEQLGRDFGLIEVVHTKKAFRDVYASSAPASAAPSARKGE